MKALVGAFNQEKALVGAFSVIVQLHRLPVCGTNVETAAEFLRVGVWAEAAASLLSRVTAMAGKKRNQYTLVRVIFRARPGRDVASTVQCQAGSYLGPETRTHSGQH